MYSQKYNNIQFPKKKTKTIAVGWQTPSKINLIAVVGATQS